MLEKVADLKYYNIKQQLADLLTKGVNNEQFLRLRDKLVSPRVH